MTPRRLAVALACAAILVLSGCGTTSSAEPGPTPTATPSPTPTPTPTLDPSDPANWVIGFGSIGPLVVGHDIAESANDIAAFTFERQASCPWLATLSSPAYGEVWAPLGDDEVIDQLVVLLFPSNPPTTPLRTAAGIAVGDTEAALLSAYPGIESRDGQYNQTYYSTTDGSGWHLNFAVDELGVVQTIVTRDSNLIDGEYCG